MRNGHTDKESQSQPLTEDDIKNFYQSVITPLQNYPEKTEMLKAIGESYKQYLKNFFSENKHLHHSQKNQLLSRLNALRKSEKFYKENFNYVLIDRIIKDIDDNGKELKIVMETVGNSELLDSIQTLYNTQTATLSEERLRYDREIGQLKLDRRPHLIDELQEIRVYAAEDALGHTNLAYLSAYHSEGLAIKLQTLANQHAEKKEYEESIKIGQRAYDEFAASRHQLDSISESTRLPSHQLAVLSNLRNTAITLNTLGLHCNFYAHESVPINSDYLKKALDSFMSGCRLMSDFPKPLSSDNFIIEMHLKKNIEDVLTGFRSILASIIREANNHSKESKFDLVLSEANEAFQIIQMLPKPLTPEDGESLKEVTNLFRGPAAQLLNKQGIAYYQKGEQKKAIEKFTEACKMLSSSPAEKIRHEPQLILTQQHIIFSMIKMIESQLKENDLKSASETFYAAQKKFDDISLLIPVGQSTTISELQKSLRNHIQKCFFHIVLKKHEIPESKLEFSHRPEDTHPFAAAIYALGDLSDDKDICQKLLSNSSEKDVETITQVLRGLKGRNLYDRRAVNTLLELPIDHMHAITSFIQSLRKENAYDDEFLLFLINFPQGIQYYNEDQIQQLRYTFPQLYKLNYPIDESLRAAIHVDPNSAYPIMRGILSLMENDNKYSIPSETFIPPEETLIKLSTIVQLKNYDLDKEINRIFQKTNLLSFEQRKEYFDFIVDTLDYFTRWRLNKTRASAIFHAIFSTEIPDFTINLMKLLKNNEELYQRLLKQEQVFFPPFNERLAKCFSEGCVNQEAIDSLLKLASSEAKVSAVGLYKDTYKSADDDKKNTINKDPFNKRPQ
jgi:hypothetical protein